jgi:hypothetical protein
MFLFLFSVMGVPYSIIYSERGKAASQIPKKAVSRGKSSNPRFTGLEPGFQKFG